MSQNRSSEWLKEFAEFTEGSEEPVPRFLDEKVLKKVNRLLNPRPVLIFFKILFTHLIVGSLSLSVCHQFGVNPFNTTYSLDTVFMNWGGHGFCMVACGLLFVGSSLAISGIFLNLEEVKTLRRTEFLQAFFLSGISLGIFMIAGAEIVFTIAGLWLFGGLIGGFVATEALWQWKKV